MSSQTEQVQSNRDYFIQKLNAEKQRNDVLKAVEANSFNFVLVDTRGRDAFASGHIRGAVCIPEAELDEAISQLPRDKEIVTYCWSHD
jgi:rhodanese-related sulfurtransferase